MQSITHTAPLSKTRLWVGRIISALPILFLVFDSVIKLMKIDPVVQSFLQLGYPVKLAREIGVLELVCVLIYAIPRTSVLGAILLAGFLGGATATHVRTEDPLFTHVLFPIYVGAMVWGGLYLRDGRLREFVPFTSEFIPNPAPSRMS
jgi:DoxX-like protein